MGKVVGRSKIPFTESPPDEWAGERSSILKQKINDLGLKLEGTRLERLVSQLYEELEQAGIDLKPPVYLADEWGCPDGLPVIGIPFYLADERLSRLEDELMEGIEAASDEDILSYLRHEAGHAFNYAYRLYETEEWVQIFGDYARPYRESYTPRPFSRNFVRHIPGWYAQKHPDEDFAETFAVWLTPHFPWRTAYEGWGCYAKLLYVDRIVKERGRTRPLVDPQQCHVTQEELSCSVEEHYRRFQPSPVTVPAYFDDGLIDIFRPAPEREDEGWESADQFLRRYRRDIIGNIVYWTGVDSDTIRSLMDHFIERVGFLDLWVELEYTSQLLMEIMAFTTTLCMNKLYTGDFVIS